MLGWLIGLIAGIWLAGQYYSQVAGWLGQWIDNFGLTLVLGFIGVWVIVMVSVGIVFWVINKIFNFIPVIGFVNRFTGGLLGLLECVLILALVFWLVGLSPWQNKVTNAMSEAQLKPVLNTVADGVKILLPTSLKTLSDLKDQIPMDQLQNPEALQNLINTMPAEELQNLKDQFDKLTPEQKAQLEQQYSSPQ